MSDAQTPGGDARGFSFALLSVDGGLQLRAGHHPQYGGIGIDWSAPEIQRRIAAGRRQPLARALGMARNPAPEILDATGGLGRDAFVLAALGAQVTLCERQSLIAALLRDALARAQADPQLRDVATRLRLIEGEAATAMAAARYDAVYLDPMYPHAGRTALAAKEMQFLRELSGGDADADALLAPALACARDRVAVKRPDKAPPLGARSPDYRISGKLMRFDVYLAVSQPL